MIRPSVSRKLMIMDACVLIDFIKTERTVLELVSKHIGPLYVIKSLALHRGDHFTFYGRNGSKRWKNTPATTPETNARAY